MSIDIYTSESSKLAVDLAVELSGMTVTLRAGTLQLRDGEFQLDDDYEFTVPQSVHAQQVSVMVMRDTGTQELSVLVDVLVEDGVDVPWDQDTDPKELVHLAARGRLQPNASDLDAEGVWSTWRIIPEGDPE